MATTTIVTLTDDLDPAQEAAETVRFSIDGKDLELDLSKKNAAAMRKALKNYVEHARRVNGRRGTTGSRSSSPRRADLAEIRSWAADSGVVLNGRGRIAGGVLAAFDAKDVEALKAATS